MRKGLKAAAIALGLAGLVGFLVLAMPDPRSDRSSDRLETDEPGATGSQTRTEGEQTRTAEVERRSNVRTVYGRRPGDGDVEPLRRVAPREPLSPIAAPQAAPVNPIERRLLQRPIALDAGRLQIGEGIVVLPGIEPPQPTAQCESGSTIWPCGAQARTALRSFLRGRSVECTAPRNFGDVQETVTSACTLADMDIAAWVVANGWAKARADGPYSDLEAAARRDGRGLWR